MLQWALKYTKLGMSVIPLKEKSKEPAIDWEEFQTRRATEQEITKWFQSPFNVGIVLGRISNLLVLDVDGVLGADFLRKQNIHSPATALSGTGSHLYFKYNGEKTQYLWKGKNEHEEVRLRSDGLYIVAPPSVHPGGKRYRWLTSVSNIILPSFPATLISTQEGIANVEQTKQPDWIDEALEDFKKGHVANTLVSILGKFRSHNFTEKSTYEFLYPHNISGEMTNEELKNKISEIWGRYEPSRVSIITPTFHKDIEEDESITEFLQDDEPTEWFCDGVFAKNSISFFAGLPESGKTWALMDLAIEVATGGKWLGLFPVKKSKVLFIDQERARPETKRRFESLFKAKGLGSGDLSLLRIKRGSSIKIDMDASYNAFSKLIEQREPELIIIDSLATFHAKESNNAMEIQSVMEKLKTLRDKFKTAFLFVHHLNKNEFQHAKEGQEPDIGLLAGSIAIPAAAETVFIVRKRLSGESTVYHCKSTMAKKINPFEFSVKDVENGIKVEGLK